MLMNRGDDAAFCEQSNMMFNRVFEALLVLCGRTFRFRITAGGLCWWLSIAFVFGNVASRAADLHVPSEFSTIQGAIDAAAPGDRVFLASGRYRETVTIAKSLSLLGSGTNDCVIYSLTNIPIISITGPVTCVLSNFEIEGGEYMGAEWYSGFSGRGIVASNAALTLDTIVMNQFINYFVTVVNGSLFATNVALWTRNVLGGCDVGFQLKGCTGSISNLRQEAGHLDHTININDPPATHSDITIDGCTIRASGLSYGNCIRTYIDSNVRISNCFMYRATNDPVPPYPAFNHNGVSISGYSNTVRIANNVITNLPWGIYCIGSLGGNQVIVENNAILNCPLGGIIWDAMSYRGIDLGGGNLGSLGGNIFTQTPAPLTNFVADVLYTNANGPSSASIFALHNAWSNPTNKDSWIYDKLDNPAMGRLITDDLTIKAFAINAAGKPVLTWADRGAGERFTVQAKTDLASSVWTNAPGSWPITNGSLKDLVWTNSAATLSNLFYRISSVVP